MTIIKSSLNTSSEEFRTRYAHNKKLVAELREMQRVARHIRPQRDLDRLSKQGKMLPRERLEKLLDPGTPFLEFSTLAANRAYNGESPSASCITGIGTISGREVVIHADDSSA
jgi:3-methylcrotonyl-CoA carboxylase beta subunit